MPIDEPYKPDTSETDGAKAIPFDLGAGEDKKVRVAPSRSNFCRLSVASVQFGNIELQMLAFRIIFTEQASVEDFMMMKVIGKGSFGRVLLGKHINSGTIYAIKVLSKEAIVKQVSILHVHRKRTPRRRRARCPPAWCVGSCPVLRLRRLVLIVRVRCRL